MGNKANNRKAPRGEKSGQTRSWKALSQDVGEMPVTPHARRRRLMPVVKGLASCGVLAGVAYIGLQVKASWSVMQRSVVAGIADDAMIQEVNFRTDGVLDESFVKQYLDMYEGSELMGADIFEIKERLESLGQVRTARVERSISNASISISVSERHPVFKMLVQGESGNELQLVDEDGVAFRGKGYTRNTLLRLPAIGGVSLQSEGGAYLPIPEVVELNHVRQTARDMMPQWFAGVRSIVIQPKSASSNYLGNNYVLRTPWCQELVLDAETLEDQLIRLDRLLADLVGGGVDLEKHTLKRIDLTIDDRAIVRFDGQNSRPNPTAPSRARIL